MSAPLENTLRSPRETLGGFVILPRLIDKVRLKAAGRLPEDYYDNLLRPIDPESGFYPLDGRFLDFTGLDPVALQRAILDHPTDEAVLLWVERHGCSRTLEERRYWARSIESSLPDSRRTEIRKMNYPSLAHRSDIGTLSPFDLIDIDEGRLT